MLVSLFKESRKDKMNTILVKSVVLLVFTFII